MYRIYQYPNYTGQ